MRRVVLERKLEGSIGDLSDAVEEALETWLSQQGEQSPSRQGDKPIKPGNAAVLSKYQFTRAVSWQKLLAQIHP